MSLFIFLLLVLKSQSGLWAEEMKPLRAIVGPTGLCVIEGDRRPHVMFVANDSDYLLFHVRGPEDRGEVEALVQQAERAGLCASTEENYQELRRRVVQGDLDLPEQEKNLAKIAKDLQSQRYHRMCVVSQLNVGDFVRMDFRMDRGRLRIKREFRRFKETDPVSRLMEILSENSDCGHVVFGFHSQYNEPMVMRYLRYGDY